MGKNVAVFVDVANIFYAAKAAGVDIDYVTLLKASSAGRDLVRAYAYTGLDPENENQRNFHDFLRRHGYRVVSKDIRKYGDGKVKANLDIELVIDMMKTARNLDVAIVVSGDGDFAPAIRAVQEMGVRVEVVSFRGNTSSDLMDVADQFTDITQIAKVEKGSSRSGRRVADDEADLSMTEVPEKQSEGAGERARGRGRTRRTAATTSPAARGRGRAAASGETPLVVLPGEKLSRVAAAAPELEGVDVEDAAAELEAGDTVAPQRDSEDGTAEDGRRRRRRRGGRGRGRGRGREEVAIGDADEGPISVSGVADTDDLGDDAPPPARRPASAFGSVWDSQIGIAASRGAPIVDDDEDLDEPAVPEYLIAERRRHDAGRGVGRGGRGRGGAYAAALDRERFGGGRGSTPSRFGEPPPRREGAFGRPDRGGRDRDRSDRQPVRQDQRPAPRSGGDEPWSEVPPEIEAMLRAQLGSRPAPAPDPAGSATAGAASEAPAGSTGTRRTGARRRSTAAAGSVEAQAVDATSAEATTAEAGLPSAPARPRTRRTPTAGESADEAAPAAPKRVATRRATTRKAATARSKPRASAAASTESSTDATPVAGDDPGAAPRRRTARRKAEPAA